MLNPASVFVILGALGSLGLFLLALRSRKVDNTPRCTACGYNLTGLTSDYCPECGVHRTQRRQIAAAGDQRRRLMLALGGVLFLVFSASLARVAWTTLSRVNWYARMSTPSLLSRLGDDDEQTTGYAAAELNRRFLLGSLSPDETSQLADWCLIEQGRDELRVVAQSERERANSASCSEVGRRAIEIVSSLYNASQLNREQERKFLENAWKFELVTRPEVPVGAPVLCEIVATERTTQTPLSGRAKARFFVDGVETGPRSDAGVIPVQLLLGGIRRRLHSRTFCCDLPGRHDLRAEIAVDVYKDPRHFELPSAYKPCYQFDCTATGSLQAVAEDADDLVQFVSDDALEAAMGRCLAVKEASLRLGEMGAASCGECRSTPDPGWTLDVALICNSAPPAPIVANMYVVHGSRRIFVTELCVDREFTYVHRVSVWNLPGALPRSVDIVLEPSRELAYQHNDVRRFWARDIVFKDVELARGCSHIEALRRCDVPVDRLLADLAGDDNVFAALSELIARSEAGVLSARQQESVLAACLSEYERPFWRPSVEIAALFLRQCFQNGSLGPSEQKRLILGTLHLRPEVRRVCKGDPVILRLNTDPRPLHGGLSLRTRFDISIWLQRVEAAGDGATPRPVDGEPDKAIRGWLRRSVIVVPGDKLDVGRYEAVILSSIEPRDPEDAQRFPNLVSMPVTGERRIAFDVVAEGTAETAVAVRSPALDDSVVQSLRLMRLTQRIPARSRDRSLFTCEFELPSALSTSLAFRVVLRRPDGAVCDATALTLSAGETRARCLAKQSCPWAELDRTDVLLIPDRLLSLELPDDVVKYWGGALIFEGAPVHYFSSPAPDLNLAPRLLEPEEAAALTAEPAS